MSTLEISSLTTSMEILQDQIDKQNIDFTNNVDLNSVFAVLSSAVDSIALLATEMCDSTSDSTATSSTDSASGSSGNTSAETSSTGDTSSDDTSSTSSSSSSDMPSNQELFFESLETGLQGISEVNETSLSNQSADSTDDGN